MDETEYRTFLASVYERYVRPRKPLLRERFHHHIEDQWGYHLYQAEKTSRFARFLEQECENVEEIYRTFALERIERAIQDTSQSLRFAHEVMGRGGYYEAIDAFESEIVAGLEPEFLPSFDDEVLQDMGFLNPEVERQTLVRLAKAQLQRDLWQPKQVDAGSRVEVAIEYVNSANSKFQKTSDVRKDHDRDHPGKSRRWFKGLGQISQGAALSIANVSVAIGTLHLPVAIETRTWGSIVSVVTGFGTIMSGIGDLRRE